jgi:hypothetical protein
MKRYGTIVLVAMLAGLVSAPAVVARGGRGKPDKESVQTEVESLISECKLSEQQQENLKAKAKAKQEAQDAWNAANAQKLQAAQDAVKTARTGSDDAAKRKANEDLRALQADLEKAVAPAEANMLAVLTTEQTVTWEAFKLYQTVLTRYRKCNLTDEQSAKVKSACTAAWKQLGEVDQNDERAYKKAKGDITGKLNWAIEQVILTEPQREAVARKPKAAPAAAPATTPAPATAPAASPAPGSKVEGERK